MSNRVVTRTVKATIQNHSQVHDDLDSHGYAASKLWNVGRWTIHRVWNAIDYIPDGDELASCLKDHAKYNDLHSQSSQKVLQELSDAFHSWYNQDNPDHNPPGYRKHGDTHPRSTVTWKNNGFKLDTKNNRVRLSKGANVSYHGLKAVAFPHDGFPAIDLRQTVADCTTPVLPEGSVCFPWAYSRRALSGKVRMACHTALIQRGLTRFTPPTEVDGAAWSASRCLGPAYDGPSEASSLATSECISQYKLIILNSDGTQRSVRDISSRSLCRLPPTPEGVGFRLAPL